MNTERFRHYILGIDSIDNQHRELFNNINIISELYDKKKLTIKEFEILQTQLERHFREEEVLMKSVGYPFVLSHTEWHNQLEAKIVEFIQRFNLSDKKMIINFLEEMIINHIDNTDRNFSEWCVNNAVLV